MTQKIENLEQICLSILAESKDPWVPMNTLVEKCKEISGDNTIDDSLVVTFLKNHSEVKVFDPLCINLPEIENILKDQQLTTQPFVILKKRLPSEKDMFIWIYRHLEKLLKILENIEKKTKEETKKQQVGNLIGKAKDLLERLKYLSSGRKD